MYNFQKQKHDMCKKTLVSLLDPTFKHR